MEHLPVEILSAIFLHTQPLYECHYKSSIYRRRRALLQAFCLVCRFWKDAAYNTPELWSLITLESSLPKAYPQMKWNLEHSKGALLDIRIDCADFYRDVGSTLMGYCVEALREVSDRWRTLLFNEEGHANLPAPHLYSVFIPSSLPALEKAALWLPAQATPHLTSTPRLYRLSLNLVHLLSVFQVPCLRSCKVVARQTASQGNTSWLEIFRLLASTCPDIEDLDISRGNSSTSLLSNSSGPWPAFLRLRSLRLLCFNIRESICILCKLALPELRSIEFVALEVSVNNAYGVSPRLPALDQLSFSSCDLYQIKQLVSQFNLPGDCKVYIETQCARLPPSSPRLVFEALEASRRWLETHADVVWTRPEQVPRTHCATYEEARGMVSVAVRYLDTQPNY